MIQPTVRTNDDGTDATTENAGRTIQPQSDYGDGIRVETWMVREVRTETWTVLGSMTGRWVVTEKAHSAGTAQGQV
jgi:hypothetical protein